MHEKQKDDQSEFMKTVDEIRHAETSAEKIRADAKEKADDVLKKAKETVMKNKTRNFRELCSREKQTPSERKRTNRSGSWSFFFQKQRQKQMRCGKNALSRRRFPSCLIRSCLLKVCRLCFDVILMLHPVKMQKIRLFALKPAADNLIRDLHSMGIMEISVSQRASGLEEGRPLDSFDEISKQHVRMRGIKNALLQFFAEECQKPPVRNR